MTRHANINNTVTSEYYDPRNPSAVAMIIEAGFRDVVDAIERAARRGDENPEAKGRARELHRDLTTARASAAQAAGLVAQTIGEYGDKDDAPRALTDTLVLLVGMVPGLELPGTEEDPFPGAADKNAEAV